MATHIYVHISRSHINFFKNLSMSGYMNTIAFVLFVEIWKIKSTRMRRTKVNVGKK